MNYLTQTRTGTSTMTAASVRIVMIEVYADFINLVAADLATATQVGGWADDLTYILENEGATGFQIQFKIPGEPMRALEYVVSADGTLKEASKAGGLNFHTLLDGTTAHLMVSLKKDSPSLSKVKDELRARKWGFDGVAVAGPSTQDRSYSSNGYGVTRTLLGNFS